MHTTREFLEGRKKKKCRNKWDESVGWSGGVDLVGRIVGVVGFISGSAILRL